MEDLEVIDDPAAAMAALDHTRARILAELQSPTSATALAATLDMPRQKVNYHLRTLEQHGLVQLAGERKHGGITERLLRATASAYIVSPTAVGARALPTDRDTDRLSASYLISMAARVIHEVATLARRARAEDKRLPTFAIDTEIGFRSAEDRAAFADELTAAATELAARYHHDDGRPHRLLMFAHPRPRES